MMMCEGIMKIISPPEQTFDPDFCTETIVFLEREIKFMKEQRSKAQEVFNQLFTGRMINPIKVMTVNDVENFVDRMTAKIEAAEMSICELNIRRHDYEIENNAMLEMPDLSILVDDESKSRDGTSFGSSSESITPTIVPSKLTPGTSLAVEKQHSDNCSDEDLVNPDAHHEDVVTNSGKLKAVGSEKMAKAKLEKTRVRKRSRTSTDSGYSSSACCSPDLQSPCTNSVAAYLGGELPYFSIDENTLPTSLFGTFHKPELATGSESNLEKNKRQSLWKGWF